MNKKDRQIILKHGVKAALLGREVVMHYFGRLKNVSEKKWAGLVSEADEESEQAIFCYLKKVLPQFSMLGEETSFKNPGQRLDPMDRYNGVWLIDPLDGTTNYVHKLPIFCVSIGLEVAGELEVAIVDVPILKRTYTATKGGGAFLNGQRLHVSDRNKFKDTLLATGFSSNDKKLAQQIQIFHDVVRRVRGVRRAGSAAFDLCLVAEGVYDAYWEKNLSPWDTAAGALLVNEAGGKVSDYCGKRFDPFDRSILASNGKVHSSLLKVIKKHSRK